MKSTGNLASANALQLALRREGLLGDRLVCVEAGARKPATNEASREPFYGLADVRVVAFEADANEAARLNQRLRSSSQVEIVGAALGARDGRALLYITRNPSCSSLFEPNDKLIGRFAGLKVAQLSHTTQVDVVALDSVCAERDVDRVDFVKMDVQGGEMGILRGGSRSLREVAAVVTEVSFQEIYKGQPLFGAMSDELNRFGLEFYGFVHTGGKSRGANSHRVSQTLWADALFLRTPETSRPDLAAKISVFSALYGAADFAEAALRSIGSPAAGKLADGVVPANDLVSDWSRLARRIRHGIGRRIVAWQGRAH